MLFLFQARDPVIRSNGSDLALLSCPPLPRHPVQDARKRSKMEFGRFSAQRRAGWSRAGLGGGRRCARLAPSGILCLLSLLFCLAGATPRGFFGEPGQTPDRALPLPSDGAGRKQRCLAFPSLTCRGDGERWWPFCREPGSPPPPPALLLSTPGGEARIAGFFRQQAVPF